MSINILPALQPLPLTDEDILDIDGLRQAPNAPSHGGLIRAEKDDDLILRVIRAGIEKIREEKAEAAYAALADDPEYRDYHQQRRAGRRARG